MEKKQSQEIVKGETVFQEEKQWYSVARVGLFCWEMELDQDRGVWKLVLVAGCDSEEAKSSAMAAEVILGHDWVVQDLWCDRNKNHA